MKKKIWIIVEYPDWAWNTPDAIHFKQNQHASTLFEGRVSEAGETPEITLKRFVGKMDAPFTILEKTDVKIDYAGAKGVLLESNWSKGNKLWLMREMDVNTE